MSDLVGNPKDRFSRVAAHLSYVTESGLILKLKPQSHCPYDRLRSPYNQFKITFLRSTQVNYVVRKTDLN